MRLHTACSWNSRPLPCSCPPAGALRWPRGWRWAAPRCGFHAVVFDAEQGPVRLGLSRELARRMNTPCLPLGK